MIFSTKIKKSPDCVFDYLTDIQKFASAHPAITKIDRKSANRYLVHETLKLGFIPVSFTYPATIDSYPEENIIIMRATVMRLTKIEMTFSLKASNGSTIIKENILFSSPLSICSVLERVFKTQHTQLFRNIEMSL
jgi:carbon monoxide dehydrogenase subunit G